MAEFFDRFWAALLNVLPRSPFSDVEFDLTLIDAQWLRWLNWFFPISACLTIMAAWLVVIGVYYLYQMVMRWIGVIM